MEQKSRNRTIYCSLLIFDKDDKATQCRKLISKVLGQYSQVKKKTTTLDFYFSI